MKSKILTTITLLIITTSTIMAQQKKEEMNVKQTITNFANAADVQDDKALELLLDNNFRLVLNQMFGNKGIAIITKQDYLAKINAAAQAIFKGIKFTVVTFLQLIKTSEGEWKIINDLPEITK
jgi:hypothetical protein